MSLVGFIGLGSMGLPMCKNILRSGYQVGVCVHHNQRPVCEAVAAGAIQYPTYNDLVKEADFVISILPADPEIKAVLLGENGILRHMRPGSILIEMTTAHPNVMRDIALEAIPLKIGILDAPVSGGVVGAVEGTLTIITGGDTEILEMCRPLLLKMGKSIFHVGDIGAAKAVKLVNQMLAGINLVAVAEALIFAERLGLDLQKVIQVVRASSGNSKVFETRAAAYMAAKMFDPGFKLKLMAKDLSICEQIALERQLPMNLGSHALQLLNAAAESGEAENDMSAIYRFLNENTDQFAREGR